MKQPEGAIAMAAEMDRIYAHGYSIPRITAAKISAELRRMHEANQVMLDALKTAHEAMMQASQKSMPVARDTAEAIHQARAAIAKGEQQ